MRSDVIKKGFERAPHRSLLKATGVTDADMGKPFIAVCNSFVEIVPGHVHLNRVGRYVKECIREAGGVAFEFNTIGVDDGIAMGHGGMLYSLPSREIIADSVETMLKAHCFDGMICIPNCDKIVPGMLMAAMRCNIPTIFVSGGPMKAGLTKAGRVVDLISVFEGVAAHKLGNLSDEGLKELEDTGCPTCGCCSGMFTANSMNCLCEALGMALPGSASVLAVDTNRDDYYREPRRSGWWTWSARTRSRATSRRWTPSTTRSRSTWRWAAPRTRSSTRWRWRTRRGWRSTWRGSTRSRGRRPRCARCRPPRSTTWRTWTARGGSRRSSRSCSRCRAS